MKVNIVANFSLTNVTIIFILFHLGQFAFGAVSKKCSLMLDIRSQTHLDTAHIYLCDVGTKNTLVEVSVGAQPVKTKVVYTSDIKKLLWIIDKAKRHLNTPNDCTHSVEIDAHGGSVKGKLCKYKKGRWAERMISAIRYFYLK